MTLSSETRSDQASDNESELTPLVPEEARKFLEGDTPVEAYIESVRKHAAREASREQELWILRSKERSVHGWVHSRTNLFILVVFAYAIVTTVLSASKVNAGISLIVAVGIGAITGIIVGLFRDGTN